jgi:hypothetical protein
MNSPASQLVRYLWRTPPQPDPQRGALTAYAIAFYRHELYGDRSTEGVLTGGIPAALGAGRRHLRGELFDTTSAALFRSVHGQVSVMDECNCVVCVVIDEGDADRGSH